MKWVWLQVVIFGGWGGHTSQNDLVAPDEVWHRFYSMGGLGARFFGYRRFQPGIFMDIGRFISQDRRQNQFTHTRWNALGLLLRLRPFKSALSPVAEGAAFRLTAMPRSMEDRTLPQVPASFTVNGLGWRAGISWRLSQWSELSLLYFWLRPQTSLLEGIAGPKPDRIEGFLGQIALLLAPPAPQPARFQ